MTCASHLKAHCPTLEENINSKINNGSYVDVTLRVDVKNTSQEQKHSSMLALSH